MTSSLLAAVDSEVALLAAAMCYPEHCGDVLDRLTPEQFGDAVHGRVWGAVCTWSDRGRTPEPPLVRDALGEDPGFEEWGGLHLLLDLYLKAYVPGLNDHADAVADRASRRAILTLTQEVQAKAPDFAAGTAEDLLAQLEHGAAEIASSGATAESWKSAGELVSGALERSRHRKGVISYPVGLQEVDALLGGLNAGETTVLGAWTGMGKTIGALQIAKANASAGLGTCYFSLEMADDPMGLRLACDLAYDPHAARYFGGDHQPHHGPGQQGHAQPWRLGTAGGGRANHPALAALNRHDARSDDGADRGQSAPRAPSMGSSGRKAGPHLHRPHRQGPAWREPTRRPDVGDDRHFQRLR